MPKEQNFTQSAIEHGYPSDYDTMFEAQYNGSLGLAGHTSKRAIKSGDDSLLNNLQRNKQAHREYAEAILKGDIIDTEGKITAEGLKKSDYDFKSKEIKSRIANIDSQIRTIENLGRMSHLENGKLKKGYQVAVDDYNSKKEILNKQLDDLISGQVTFEKGGMLKRDEAIYEMVGDYYKALKHIQTEKDRDGINNRIVELEKELIKAEKEYDKIIRTVDDMDEIRNSPEKKRSDYLRYMTQRAKADIPSVLFANYSDQYENTVNSPEFIAWFGDWRNAYKVAKLNFRHPVWENVSKVVDENGKPLVVFHRTDNKFTVFDKEKLGESTKWNTAYWGFYFSNYNEKGSYGKRVVKCFLNIKNPYRTFVEIYADFDYKTINVNKFSKNDGIRVQVKRVLPDEKANRFFVAFKPEQIKLADGTNRLFNPNNPDIRFKKGGTIDALKEVSLNGFITDVPFKGLQVRMADLKKAEKDLAEGRKSITPNEPVEVTFNITTGEIRLSDGYHRYLDARGGNIQNAIDNKPDTRNGSIKGIIKLEITKMRGGFERKEDATGEEISDAYNRAKTSGEMPELVRIVEEIMGNKQFKIGGNIDNLKTGDDGGFWNIENVKPFAEKYLKLKVVNEIDNGTYGVSYITDKNTKLKITLSKKEYIFWGKQIGTENDLLPDVYAVGEVVDGIFYIEMEYLESLTENDSKILDYVVNGGAEISDLSELDKEKIKEYNKRYWNIKHLLPREVNDYWNVSNYGLKNGKLAIFDPVYEKGGRIESNEEVANFKRKYPFVKEVEIDITQFKNDVDRWHENALHPQDKATIEYLLTQDASKQPPIIIGRYDNRYRIIDGWHRIYAALKQGKTKLLALIEPDVESTAKALEEIAKTNSEILNTFPSVVYHGTQDKGYGSYKYTYFSSDKEYAKTFAEEKGRVVAKLVTIKNPFKIIATYMGYGEIVLNDKIIGFYRDLQPDAVDKLKVRGYDGIIVDYPAKNKIALEVIPFDSFQIKEVTPQNIAEAYHAAKADGSNPKLVKAVEDALTQSKLEKGGNVDGLKDVVLAEDLAKEMANSFSGKTEEDALSYLKELEDYFILETVPLNSISFDYQGLYFERPDKSQEVIKSNLDKLRDGKTLRPLILNSKGQVVDGNHRALSHYLNGDENVQVYVPIGTDIKKFDNLNTRFHRTGTSYEKYYGKDFYTKAVEEALSNKMASGGVIVPEIQSSTYLKYGVSETKIEINKDGYVFENGRRMYSANSYTDGYDYIKRYYPEIVDKFINPKPKKERQSGSVIPQTLILKRSGIITKQQMIKEGANGYLSTAFERYIPIDKIEGEDPENATWTDDEGFDREFYKGEQIKTPIEVIYEKEFDRYILYGGNHRLKQARMNGQRYIAAYIQPDKGSIGDAKLKNPDLKFEKGGSVDSPNYESTIHSPEFIAYFGNWERAYKVAGLDFTHPAWKNVSKSVDTQGKPLQVFHASNTKFDIFEIDKSSYWAIYYKGFYFTDNKKIANDYLGGILDHKSEESHIKKCFLNIRNPYLFDAEITDAEINVWKQIFHSKEDDFYFKRIWAYKLPKKWENGLTLNLFNRHDLLQFKNHLVKQGAAYSEDKNILTRNDVYGIISDDFNIGYIKEWLNKSILSKKYDGFIIHSKGSGLQNKKTDSLDHAIYVVHKSNQIKLADGTNTTFDAKNPNIHLEKGGRTYWGNKAAGCLFYSKNTGRVLVAHRSDDVFEPNTWGTWGGKTDGDEEVIEALDREVREETEYYGEYEAIPVYVYKDKNFEYHNYLTIIEDEFIPSLNWETQDFGWFDINKMPSKLHFGLKLALPYFKEVIRAKFEKGGILSNSLPKELTGGRFVGNTGFGGVREHTIGRVRLEDLKVLPNAIETAENTFKANPKFKVQKSPITVGIDIYTGEKLLLDGYHRYVDKKGYGEMSTKFLPMKDGNIISF
jgi:8-oxo-dGTP pyrophosphatase MutT (NUDIX family)